MTHLNVRDIKWSKTMDTPPAYKSALGKDVWCSGSPIYHGPHRIALLLSILDGDGPIYNYRCRSCARESGWTGY